MGTLVVAVVVVVIVFAILGAHRKSAIRRTGRVALGVLFALSLLVTLALAAGSIALSDKGGGVLFLFALPAAFVSWLVGAAFFGSVRNERYFDLTVDEKTRHNLASLDRSIEDLRASIGAKTAERARFWTSAKRRAQLDRELRHEREMLARLPQLRPALEKPETYANDEP